VTGTMKVLRLPSPFSFSSASLVQDTACDTTLFSLPYKAAVFTLQDRTILVWPVLLLTMFRAEELGSPVFPCNPHLSLPGSQTPTEPPQLAFFTLLWCCPGSFEFQDFGDNEYFEALSQGFNSHCLRFVPAFLQTTQDSFPADG
jgi:hypothetical protein